MLEYPLLLFETWIRTFIYVLENQVGAGAFGEVYIADAVGMTTFDPRYNLNMKHKALLSRKRFSINYFQRSRSPTSVSKVSRNDSVASSRLTKSSIKDRSQYLVVAVKKLKGNIKTNTSVAARKFVFTHIVPPKALQATIRGGAAFARSNNPSSFR